MTTEEDAEMEAIGQATAVAAVLGVLLVVLFWLRRRGLAIAVLPGRRGVRRLESLERLALSPQHVLHVVRFRDHTLLVACSPGQCSLLERVDGCDAPGAEVCR
jgi:flagellar biogenesis protein FliO